HCIQCRMCIHRHFLNLFYQFHHLITSVNLSGTNLCSFSVGSVFDCINENQELQFIFALLYLQ
ncbi:MAG TPA: hypothetical protein PLZ77_11095, partial [Lachnospiraceae bacterium]|nr:hypothetical protein [Lachnospiraceae bacterium]